MLKSISLVYFNNRWWKKITPPWIKGRRPTVTYKELDD